MRKWKCTICGEIVVGDKPPANCPLCNAPAEKFVEVFDAPASDDAPVSEKPADDMTWAAEHKVGITAGGPREIIEGLRANFKAECSEVGMYLAMSRVAYREGYPEIGEYYKTAAYEEAGHAALFAEMLGEVVTDSTKKNLELRVAAENGATQGKVDLAAMAKQNNLDAIHDSVHEMARDEARHGKAFKGLLDRYFGK